MEEDDKVVDPSLITCDNSDDEGEVSSNTKIDENENVPHEGYPIADSDKNTKSGEEKKQLETEKAEVTQQEKQPNIPQDEKVKEVKEAPVVEKQEAKSSGWGSWGSWISSTVSTVVDSSSKLVQDLTTAVESETELQRPSQRGGLKLYRTEEDIEKEEEEKKQMDLEDKLIHSTTEVLSGTSTMLSSVINKGVERLQQVDVDGIVAQADKVGKSTMDMSQKFMNQTVETFGTVSGRAKGLFGEEASTNPAQQAQGSGEKVKQKKIMDFPAYFEDFMGNVHLQALELLSTECTMKVQEIQRKCDPDTLSNLVVFLQMISEMYENEDDEEEPEPLELSEKSQAIQAKMNDISQNSKSELSILTTNFKVKLESLNQESEEKSLKEKAITELFDEYLNTIHQQGLRTLAQLSACCVELINRISENWLVQSQQEKKEEGSICRPEITITKVKCIVSLSNNLADEISTVSMSFVQACRTIASQTADIFNDDISQSFRSKSKAQINIIYADAGDAIAKVHDAKEFTTPVLQWIYILSESHITVKA